MCKILKDGGAYSQVNSTREENWKRCGQKWNVLDGILRYLAHLKSTYFLAEEKSSEKNET